MIWLDNAATTLIKPYSVGAAVARAMREAASVGRGALLKSETGSSGFRN